MLIDRPQHVLTEAVTVSRYTIASWNSLQTVFHIALLCCTGCNAYVSRDRFLRTWWNFSSSAGANPQSWVQEDST